MTGLLGKKSKTLRLPTAVRETHRPLIRLVKTALLATSRVDISAERKQRRERISNLRGIGGGEDMEEERALVKEKEKEGSRRRREEICYFRAEWAHRQETYLAHKTKIVQEIENKKGKGNGQPA